MPSNLFQTIEILNVHLLPCKFRYTRYGIIIRVRVLGQGRRFESDGSRQEHGWVAGGLDALRHPAHVVD
jgi:hypothetical protein